MECSCYATVWHKQDIQQVERTCTEARCVSSRRCRQSCSCSCALSRCRTHSMAEASASLNMSCTFSETPAPIMSAPRSRSERMSEHTSAWPNQEFVLDACALARDIYDIFNMQGETQQPWMESQEPCILSSKLADAVWDAATLSCSCTTASSVPAANCCSQIPVKRMR